MHNLTIKSSSGTYSACVGENIFNDSLSDVLKNTASDKIFLLIDENVHKHHGDTIIKTVKNLCDDVSHFLIPKGEESKSVSLWSDISDFLLTHGVRRNTPLIVVGGGVTGDLGGFAAATTLRGIPLIHVPTTVLAMVDSSIGGKTGINHNSGKNLIGAFYRPEAVIADTRFLDSLPRGEWINGLSEILKYGAISDQSIFDEASVFFEENTANINREKLISLVAKCIQIKADIVERDEFEGGVRAFLNYGHTFAHALEKESNYNMISHGEAVFLGMLAAGWLSKQLGGKLDVNHLDNYRKLYSYRVSSEELSSNNLVSHMQSDKKRIEKHLRFVLLDQWQHPVLKTVKDRSLIEQAWNKVFEELQQNNISSH